MPKRINPDEKRVKLNCLVDLVTMDWLKSAKGSQGEAVDYAVASAMMAEAAGRVMPQLKRRQSRREKEVESRQQSDVVAQIVERDDIDYSDTESTPTTHAALQAVADDDIQRFQQTKNAVADWRANRKPIPKPGDRK